MTIVFFGKESSVCIGYQNGCAEFFLPTLYWAAINALKIKIKICPCANQPTWLRAVALSPPLLLLLKGDIFITIIFTRVLQRTYAFPPSLHYCQIIRIDLQLKGCISKLFAIKNSFGLHTCEILISSPILEHFKVCTLILLLYRKRRITSHCKVTESEVEEGNCYKRARQCYFVCQIVYWITLQPYQRLKLPDLWETGYCPPWPLYKQGVAFASVAGPRRPDVGLYRPTCTSRSSIGSFGGAKVMHPSLASISHCTFKEAKWNFRDLSMQVRYQYVELSIIVQCTRKVRNPCSLDDFTENVVKIKVRSCGVWFSSSVGN
jgi:hypothetical protein